MTWVRHLSRWINWHYFGGDPEEMLSSRIHRERWWCERYVDMLFFWHRRHCERCYWFEQRRKMWE